LLLPTFARQFYTARRKFAEDNILITESDHAQPEHV
jgi:hypothetical protein